MKQEEKNFGQDESTGRETDVTRTERREAVSNDQVENDDNATGGRDQNTQTGSHQEGQYSKQSNKPEVNK